MLRQLTASPCVLAQGFDVQLNGSPLLVCANRAYTLTSAPDPLLYSWRIYWDRTEWFILAYILLGPISFPLCVWNPHASLNWPLY
jgi:hypothetical protein